MLVIFTGCAFCVCRDGTLHLFYTCFDIGHNRHKVTLKVEAKTFGKPGIF